MHTTLEIPEFQTATVVPALAEDIARQTDRGASGTICKFLQERAELEAAFRLVYSSYRRAGLIERNPAQMRVTPFHLNHTTEICGALLDGTVICTMSLVGDGPMGLPMEEIYADEVSRLREAGFALAEVSCLADRRGDHRTCFPVLGRLMAFVAQSAKRRGIDLVLIAVHPHHAKFYERYIAFQRFGAEKSYPCVQDHPAIALALDLNRLEIDHPKAFRRLFGERFSDRQLQHQRLDDAVRQYLKQLVEASNPLSSVHD